MLLLFLFEDQYFHICVLFHCSFFCFFFAFVICWIFSGCSHHSKPCLQNQYFNPRRPPDSCHRTPQPQWSRPEHLETALKVAINQTDEFTKFIFLLFFLVFVFNSKNISNALIMKNNIYTHIYIITAVREYLIPQRFCPELCPNWWKRGGVLLVGHQTWRLCSSRAPALCLCWFTVQQLSAIHCVSLC